MNTQIITTPTGERLVVLPEADYEALLDAADDAADAAALRSFRARLASGEEELLPAAMVERILAGENAVRVWREHRGLTVRALAEKAGLTQPFVSQIETGKRDGTVATMRRIAEALGVALDDLVA
jgi:DNA-binding XRE family transcriptional regulator/PHD/YefM family antitoxin component YafN of YafNO toxin-antitoxin module